VKPLQDVFSSTLGRVQVKPRLSIADSYSGVSKHSGQAFAEHDNLNVELLFVSHLFGFVADFNSKDQGNLALVVQDALYDMKLFSFTKEGDYLMNLKCVLLFNFNHVDVWATCFGIPRIHISQNTPRNYQHIIIWSYITLPTC
jgi:hypothetical protein